MSEQEKNTEQGVHKRRTRYKGKYPRKFEEKYKELQPEKYQDMIAHVIQKGNTPAGMHISIMVQEILDFLKIQPGEVGFDATLGYGGHTKAHIRIGQSVELLRKNLQRQKNVWKNRDLGRIF